MHPTTYTMLSPTHCTVPVRCCRVVISLMTMAQVASPSMAPALLMRTSTCVMLVLVCCLWLMLDPTQMAASSSCALQPQLGWMTSTLCLARWGSHPLQTAGWKATPVCCAAYVNSNQSCASSADLLACSHPCITHALTILCLGCRWCKATRW